MADDAFALSPISARASLPTEADYEAICSAFMETARGRWFLTEYAKRNRNADTRMVLDAVERLESALASQKAAAGQSLAELLPAITGLIVEARQRILEGLPKTDLRPATEPIQRAAGILRDVAWTLRESGADTRVCDLLDVQAKAIVDGCTKIHGDPTAASDASATVTAALDTLARQIGTLVRTDVTMPAPPAETLFKTEPPAGDRRAEPATAPVQDAATSAAMLDVVAPDELPEQPTAETAEVAEIVAWPEAEKVDRQVAPAQSSQTMLEADVQANLWEDLEVTDVGPNENPTEPKIQVAAVAAAAIAQSPATLEPPAADETLGVEPDIANQARAVEIESEAPQKAMPSSLGQAALDSGIVAPPSGRYAEALAQLRRMSQAERIAFFS